MELDLKNLLARTDLSRKDKILLLLASESTESGQSVAALRALATQNGLPQIKKWNVSQILKSLGKHATRLPAGWIITVEGKAGLAALGILTAPPSKALQPTLHKYAASLANENIKKFVDEAIFATEYNLYRSAVVLSWVGAVRVLYEVVINNHLSDFNKEAALRFPKWKPAKSADDLTKIREFDFLQVACALGVFGKNTKDELENCLKLRNTCGHPNSHTVGEHRVTAHLEILILNVFSKYVI